MLMHAVGKEGVPFVRVAIKAEAVEVAVAQEGDSADYEFRKALCVVQKQDFLFRFERMADDMHVHRLQESLGGVEEGWGVVVAGGEDDVAAGALGRFAEEAIVQGLGLIGGKAAVEDVAGDEENVYGFVAQYLYEPFEEEAELFVPFPAVESLPEMPVGSMEYFHGVSCASFGIACKAWAVIRQKDCRIALKRKTGIFLRRLR
jgi:hypothetical protein